MHCIRWPVKCLLFGLLACGVHLTLARDAEPLSVKDTAWSRYVSPNFELYSRWSDARSRQLLRNLEILRAVFIDRLHLVERAHIEVTLFAFDSETDFLTFARPSEEKNTKSVAGFYLGGSDRAVILLAPREDSESARRVIFHEYVHHLFRIGEEEPPVWYDEGMAELFAGIRVNDDSIELGHPVADRVRLLQRENLLALETLFSVTHASSIYTSDERAGLFYAQSWALLHYLHFGDSDLPAEGVDSFLRAASRRDAIGSLELRTAFKSRLGIDYPEMLKRLRHYVQSGSYRYRKLPLPTTPERETYGKTAIAPEIMRLRLAELNARVQGTLQAEDLLATAALFAPGDPRPLETLGTCALNRGDRRGAEDFWEKALAAGSENPAVIRELAMAECRELFGEFDFDYRPPSDLIDRLRARLMRSLEREPHQYAVLQMLAWVEAYAPKPVVANVVLVQQRFDELPDRARTLIALAMIRVRIGRKEEALKMLEDMDYLAPDRWAAQAAEVISARLEDRQVQLISDAPAGTRQQTELSTKRRAGLKIPSVPLPDDL